MRGFCLVDINTNILSQDPLFQQAFVSENCDGVELKMSRLFDTTLSFEEMLKHPAARRIVPAICIGTGDRFQVEIVPLRTEQEILFVVQVEQLTEKGRTPAATPSQETALVGGDKASDLDPFFDVSPLPMWIFNTETLRFVAVNEAAVQKYGWSRDEFFAKTILDIRPESERKRVGRIVNSCSTRVGKSGPWVHQNRLGETWPVDILTHAVTYQEMPCRLVKVLELPLEARLSKTEGASTLLTRSTDLVESREARIVEMKREINELLSALGREPKFQSVLN